MIKHVQLYNDNSLYLETDRDSHIALYDEDVKELKDYLNKNYPHIDYKQVEINKLKKQIQELQEKLAKIEND